MSVVSVSLSRISSAARKRDSTSPAPSSLLKHVLYNSTSSLKGAAPLVSSLSQQQEGNRLQLALWERARESSGGGLHRKDLNKLGSRFKTGSGRSSWSWVSCDHLSLASHSYLLCGLWMLLPHFHKDRLEEMYSCEGLKAEQNERGIYTAMCKGG